MAQPRPTRAAAALALSLLTAGATQAATSIYLDLPNVAGTSTNAAHRNWIEAQSLQFGVDVAVNNVVGSSGRNVGKPILSDLSWSQAMDLSFPRLFSSATTGSVVPASTFDLVAAGSSNGKPYLQLKAEKAAVTSVSMANTSVAGSLGYSKLSLIYDPAAMGNPKVTDPVVTTSYDLLTGKTVGPTGATPKLVKGNAPAAQGGEASMYLRLGSGKESIGGTSTALGYENWIKIDSAQMGVSRPYNHAAGSGGGGVGKPSISDLTWSQSFDKSVPVVFADLLRGTHIEQATIEYVTSGANGPVTFMQLALNDVLFSSLSLSTGGDLPSVSGSMNFTSFSQTVWDIKSDGTRGTASRFGYDILHAKGNAGSLASNVTGFGDGNLAPLALEAAESQSNGIGLPAPSATLVPEPQSWALMLAGGALLAGLARRRLG